jgi:hypothetical protein
MLALESHRWSQLTHAYGPATDIPALLRALKTLPAAEGKNEPWFSLWSALAHQGDVFESSYAAVPHVVEALTTAPDKADASYFHFPAWVEICRAKGGPSIPNDLEAPYFEALQRLPALVSAASHASWSPEHLGCCMAALAVAKGQPAMAEAALELTPVLAEQYLARASER